MVSSLENPRQLSHPIDVMWLYTWSFVNRFYFFFTPNIARIVPLGNIFFFLQRAICTKIRAFYTPDESRSIMVLRSSIRPSVFRFIIEARNCVTNQVAKKFVKILQLIMKINRKYCNKIKFYTRIERFWIIENNAQVLEDITFINSKRNARNVKTFDFSTSYTIPRFL